MDILEYFVVYVVVMNSWKTGSGIHNTWQEYLASEAFEMYSQRYVD
jgi:hypothetical protein